MIVSCPSCTTRYDLGHQAQNDVLTLTCRRCGHHWKKYPAQDVVPVSASRSLQVIEPEPEPDLDVARLVEAAKSARIQYAAKRVARFKKGGGWASLGLCAVLPFIFALVAPEATVMAAPMTAKLYQKLGWAVNIYGLDIRRVEQLNKNIDGQHILMVKGEISNSTNDVRKIPSMRFALNDADGKELYSWTLDTTARPLRPGETTAFSTRIAAPPELANTLQIRFAHVSEIGSNPAL
ncbi:MAG TPA: FxLYD domain-containing protein [Aestuariivirga sp.]